MELADGDLIFFGRERCGCGPHCCKRQLCHCFISCGTCSEYTHVGIIKIEDVPEDGNTRKEIFVYESARHHHGFDENGDPVHKEGVQKKKLSYYQNRDWYVRKRIGSWNVQLNEYKYRKGYNWCMWDWCRARIRCRSCCRYSKKTFCSEYVAAQLGFVNADLVTPKDLANNKGGKLKDYDKIEGPILKDVFPVETLMHAAGVKLNF